MKIIAIGCEYAGVSTLLDGLLKWGRERNWNFHLDDHFAIPDRFHLEPAEQREMVGLSPALKERFQRMQIAYHFGVLKRYDHCLFSGYHIEEEIYGPRYYYPGMQSSPASSVEPDIPADAILVHLHARAEVIEARMTADPHEFQVIEGNDIPELLGLFADGYRKSTLHNRFEIDTSDMSGDELLSQALTSARPLLTVKDLLLLAHDKLDD